NGGGGWAGFAPSKDSVALVGVLAQRPGLAEKVTSRQGTALELPFPEASFDLVWSQNAAMNIGARDRLYGEMRRVLTPAGRLAFQDVAAGAAAAPPHPPPPAHQH